MAGHGGARPNSGPKRGRKRRAAIGAQIAELERARDTGVVTEPTLDAYNQLCAVGILFFNQAIEQQQLKDAKAESFDREFFNEALRDARDTFKEIVKYQRPALKAMFLAGDPLGLHGLAPAKPAGGESAVPFPTDPAAAARAYQRMMAAAYGSDRRGT
jgi:hypothetical protein